MANSGALRARVAHERALNAHEQAAQLHEDAAALHALHAEHSREHGNVAQAERAEKLAVRERELTARAVRVVKKERNELAHLEHGLESKRPKR